MPAELKTAMLQNELAPLIVDGTKKAKYNLPVTPTMSSTPRAEKDREPAIYCLSLMNKQGEHPTPRQLEAILDAADDYLMDVDIIPGSNADRRPRSTLAEMQPIIDIENAASKAHGTKSDRDLTDAKWQEAQTKGTKLPCKYVKKKIDVDNIRRIGRHTRKWLAGFQRANSSPDEPFPWTLMSVGWTNEDPRRRYHYETHNNVSTHITIFDAIARSLGSHALRWRLVYKPHSADIVETSEHVISVMSGFYIVMNGLNIVAAGGSNETRSRTWVGTYDSIKAATKSRQSFRANAKAIVKQIMDERRDILRVKALDQIINEMKETNTRLSEAKTKEREQTQRQQKVDVALTIILRKFLPAMRRQMAEYKERKRVLPLLQEAEAKVMAAVVKAGLMNPDARRPPSDTGPTQQETPIHSRQNSPARTEREGSVLPSDGRLRDLMRRSTTPSVPRRRQMVLVSRQSYSRLGASRMQVLTQAEATPEFEQAQHGVTSQATTMSQPPGSRSSSRSIKLEEGVMETIEEDVEMPDAPSGLGGYPDAWPDNGSEDDDRDNLSSTTATATGLSQRIASQHPFSAQTTQEPEEGSESDNPESPVGASTVFGSSRTPVAHQRQSTVNESEEDSDEAPIRRIRGRRPQRTPSPSSPTPRAQPAPTAPAPAPAPVQLPRGIARPVTYSAVQKVQGRAAIVDEITNVTRGERSKYSVTVQFTDGSSGKSGWSDVSKTAPFALADYLHLHPNKRNQFPHNWAPPITWTAPP